MTGAPLTGKRCIASRILSHKIDEVTSSKDIPNQITIKKSQYERFIDLYSRQRTTKATILNFNVKNDGYVSSFFWLIRSL